MNLKIFLRENQYTNDILIQLDPTMIILKESELTDIEKQSP